MVARMLRKTLILLLVLISVLATVLGLLHLYNKSKIPEELLERLESDLVSHLSINLTILIPSTIDELIGYQAFRYQVKDIETIEYKTEASSGVSYCLKVLVTYRVPEKSSVYAPGSPFEEFLYLAWQENAEWQVRKLAQSGVNSSLGGRNCSEWLDGQ